MKKFLPVLALALLSGCATTPPPPVLLTIESDPAGAKIFCGENYLGTTPVTTEIKEAKPGTREVNPQRVFAMSDFVRPELKFTAKLGEQTQTKVFKGAAMFYPADKLPERILFEFEK